MIQAEFIFSIAPLSFADDADQLLDWVNVRRRASLFYAIGTGLGGVAAPLVFGKLIESGSRQSIFGGYLFAAVLMFAAAFVAARYAVAAERKPLEQVATPPLGSDLKAAMCAGSERRLISTL
jgi:MFS family permease